MRERKTSQRGEKASSFEISGVLETIAAGLSLVVAKPYLLALPLIVDLVTWLGFQIGGEALTSRLSRLMIDRGGSNGPDAARTINDLGENLRVNDVIASLMPSVFGGLPRDSVFNALIHLLAPGITEGVDRARLFDSWGQGLISTWNPGSWVDVVGLVAGMFAIATVLTVLFHVPIALAVRSEPASIGRYLTAMMAGWFRLVALIAMIGATLAVLFIPIVIASAVFLVMGLNLVGVLALALVVFGGLASMYTLFVFDAMLLNSIGPLRALRQSYRVVRSNFGPSMQLAFANLLIATGFLHVSQIIVENPPGVVFALIGNALIGTGLSVASMMFFYDRYRLIPEVSLPTPRTY